LFLEIRLTRSVFSKRFETRIEIAMDIDRISFGNEIKLILTSLRYTLSSIVGAVAAATAAG